MPTELYYTKFNISCISSGMVFKAKPFAARLARLTEAEGWVKMP